MKNFDLWDVAAWFSYLRTKVTHDDPWRYSNDFFIEIYLDGEFWHV